MKTIFHTSFIQIVANDTFLIVTNVHMLTSSAEHRGNEP
jgi:hypothetical protein